MVGFCKHFWIRLEDTEHIYYCFSGWRNERVPKCISVGMLAITLLLLLLLLLLLFCVCVFHECISAHIGQNRTLDPLKLQVIVNHLSARNLTLIHKCHKPQSHLSSHGMIVFDEEIYPTIFNSSPIAFQSCWNLLCVSFILKEDVSQFSQCQSSLNLKQRTNSHTILWCIGNIVSSSMFSP